MSTMILFLLGTKEEEGDREGGLMDLGLETKEEGDDALSLVVGVISLKPLEMMSLESKTSDCDGDDEPLPYFVSSDG